MNFPILVVYLVLFGMIESIRRLSGEWGWLKSQTSKIPYFNAVTIWISVLLLLGGVFHQVKTVIDKRKYSVFVSPGEIIVSPGFSKKSILKIVNNNDYPLYQIDIRIAVDKGDLSVDAVKLDLKDKIKLESNTGGVTIAYDVFGLGIITKDGKRENKIIVYEIDAHSTKELFVDIAADNIKEKSTVVFEIVRSDTKPTEIISFDPFIMCQANDKDYKTYHETSKTMLDQRRYKEALVCCEKAIAKNPKSAPTYNNKGVAFLFLDQVDSAINSFEKAIELGPQLPRPYLNLAGILMGKKRFEEAIKYIEIVAEIEEPEQSDAFVLWGRYLAIQNDTKGAVEKYRQAISINPSSGPAFYFWGLLLKDTGDCEQAVDKFKRATELEHKYKLDSIGMLGGCLETLGKYKEALNLYQSIIDKAPNSSQASRSKNSIESLNLKVNAAQKTK